jgi:hypothetical protein
MSKLIKALGLECGFNLHITTEDRDSVLNTAKFSEIACQVIFAQFEYQRWTLTDCMSEVGTIILGDEQRTTFWNCLCCMIDYTYQT